MALVNRANTGKRPLQHQLLLGETVKVGNKKLNFSLEVKA